jgi:hypothetical protein
VSLAQEELREFESEFEMIAGEKNERYRDLKLKERQLDEFLGTFDVQKLEVEANVTERQGEIVRLLRQISANCQRDELVANVTAMDESFIIGSSIETNASAGELQDCKYIHWLLFKWPTLSARPTTRRNDHVERGGTTS